MTLSVEERSAGILRISVVDSGIGIAKEMHDKIFIPFSRLGLENSEITGSGIGLTITKELVEAMGGKIGFDSTPDLGSTFWLEFPIVNGRLTQRAPDDMPDTDDDADDDDNDKTEIAKFVSNQQILCVEDNPSNLKLLEKLIGNIPGTHIITAHTGELGLDLAEIYLPNVIIMDINLPGMDGLETLRRLRLLPSTKDIPVIALTAMASDGDKSRGIDAGFAEYLTKPINVQEVTSVLNEILQST